MEKLTTPGSKSSSEVWGHLEELVRAKVREFIARLGKEGEALELAMVASNCTRISGR